MIGVSGRRRRYACIWRQTNLRWGALKFARVRRACEQISSVQRKRLLSSIDPHCRELVGHGAHLLLESCLAGGHHRRARRESWRVDILGLPGGGDELGLLRLLRSKLSFCCQSRCEKLASSCRGSRRRCSGILGISAIVFRPSVVRLCLASCILPPFAMVSLSLRCCWHR